MPGGDLDLLPMEPWLPRLPRHREQKGWTRSLRCSVAADAPETVEAMIVVVCDLARKINGVNAIMDVQRFEIAGDQLACEMNLLSTGTKSPQP